MVRLWEGERLPEDWKAAAQLISELKKGDIFYADKFPTLKCMMTFEERIVTGTRSDAIYSAILANGTDERWWSVRDFIYNQCRMTDIY